MFHANQLRIKRRALSCAVALALVLLNGASVRPTAAFPDKTAEDLSGKALDPLRVSQGRLVVLVFVRTDCPISNRYAPLLQELSEKFRGKINFWLVYPDRNESAPQIKTHLQEFHYSIPALRDTQHALVKRSQATITPEAALFDPSGRLLYHGRIDNWYEDFGRARSAPTTHELNDAISAALEGRTVGISHANAVGCYISDLK